MGVLDTIKSIFTIKNFKLFGLALLLIITLIGTIALIAFGVYWMVKKIKGNRENFQAIKSTTGSLTDELQKYIQSWNSTVDSYYGIKSNPPKEGFSLTKKGKVKKPEGYESTRLANGFAYLKTKK